MFVCRTRRFQIFEVMIVLAVLNFNAFTQELPTIAVATFGIMGGCATLYESESITELFIAELTASKKVKVIDRNGFDRIISEMKQQTFDWSDNQKTAEIGKLSSADFAIRGQFIKAGNKIYLMLTMINLETAETLCFIKEKLTDINKAPKKLNALSSQILKKLSD